MDKPHLSKFVFEAFDPVHEAGKQAFWWGELAEFQKGSDGIYRKVRSGALTLAQLEAQGYDDKAVRHIVANVALHRAEAAEAQVAALTNDIAQAKTDRDRAVTRAAEQALDYGRNMNTASDRIMQLEKQLEKSRNDMVEALAARDNFAALEKKARGELMEKEAWLDSCEDAHTEAQEKLSKIPRLIRRLFGAI